MDGKGQSSYAKTKRIINRQKRRYQRQKIFLCIALLFSIVLALRCLTKIYVIEGRIWGAEQAEEREAGGVLPGQNAAAGVAQASADGITEMETGTKQVKEGAAVRLSESEQQEWKKIYRENEQLLILVNKEHSMTKEQELPMRVICNGRLSAADCLYNDLCDMLTDAKKERYEYWIASAYRSKEKQQQLVEEDVRKYLAQGCTYEKALKKTYDYTMPAGYSEHQTGLSLDILCAGNINMDDSQAEEPGNKWLKEHCHEYGFILRYPESKESVTGIRYEPWHFRYVGKEAAAWLAERDLTLEDVLPLNDTKNTGQNTAL